MHYFYWVLELTSLREAAASTASPFKGTRGDFQVPGQGMVAVLTTHTPNSCLDDADISPASPHSVQCVPPRVNYTSLLPFPPSLALFLDLFLNGTLQNCSGQIKPESAEGQDF